MIDAAPRSTYAAPTPAPTQHYASTCLVYYSVVEVEFATRYDTFDVALRSTYAAPTPAPSIHNQHASRSRIWRRRLVNET
eukprot:2159820-Pyramimonas_sp.AAC.1